MQLQNLNGTLEKIKVEAQNYNITAPLSGIIENLSGILCWFILKRFTTHCLDFNNKSINCKKYSFAKRYRSNKTKPKN